MKGVLLRLLFILSLSCFVLSCNDEVFVSRHPMDEPADPDEPDKPDDPYDGGYFMLSALVYDDATLGVEPEDIVITTTATFINKGPEAYMTVLFDNYNQSVVSISNSTYYVYPWAPATEQPFVEIPGLDKEGIPGFYGQEIPFSFGRTVVPYQYMEGHKESFRLSTDRQVTANITITRRTVRARADIKYYMSNFPNSFDTGWVVVSAQIPVDIRVEWSKVTAAPES